MRSPCRFEHRHETGCRLCCLRVAKRNAANKKRLAGGIALWKNGLRAENGAKQRKQGADAGEQARRLARRLTWQEPRRGNDAARFALANRLNYQISALFAGSGRGGPAPCWANSGGACAESGGGW